MNNQKCNGLMGAIFGHNFKPRITLGAPTITSVKLPVWGDANSMIDIIEASKKQTYHGDICSRCGSSNDRNSSIHKLFEPSNTKKTMFEEEDDAEDL